MGCIGNEVLPAHTARKPTKTLREQLAAGDTFDDCIFTDECSIQLQANGPLTFHRWWEPRHIKGKAKHPTKVHVWAGISKAGPTPIVVFTGIMEKFFCTGKDFIILGRLKVSRS